MDVNVLQSPSEKRLVRRRRGRRREYSNDIEDDNTTVVGVNAKQFPDCTCARSEKTSSRTRSPVIRSRSDFVREKIVHTFFQMCAVCKCATLCLRSLPQKNESAIVNLDNATGPVTHWLRYKKRRQSPIL